MNKTTLNRILLGIIVMMSLSICVLIVCIMTRPRYVNTSEENAAVIIEVPPDAGISVASADETAGMADTAQTQTQDLQDSASAAHQKGKTSTRVNIRNAPTEDAKVLDTVDEGTTFEIVEILDNGWTHVIYEDQDAYICSAYVIIINS